MENETVMNDKVTVMDMNNGVKKEETMDEFYDEVTDLVREDADLVCEDADTNSNLGVAYAISAGVAVIVGAGMLLPKVFHNLVRDYLIPDDDPDHKTAKTVIGAAIIGGTKQHIYNKAKRRAAKFSKTEAIDPNTGKTRKVVSMEDVLNYQEEIVKNW